MAKLDELLLSVGISRDTAANRPAAGNEGRIFFETDTGRVLFDNGASWIEMGLSESQISHDNIDDVSTSDHHTKYALTDDLTADEITQIQNIDTETVSNAQWGYLGAMAAQPLESMVEDLSPQLGGNLDLNAKDIVDTGANVILSSNGTGNIDSLATLAVNIAFSGAQTVDGVDISAHDGGAIETYHDISGLELEDLGDVSLADPAADHIVFWDDSDSQFEFLVPNTLLSISGNNLNVDEESISHDNIADVSTSDHHTKYALTDDLTADEITQIQNIDTETVSNAQWGYLGAMAAQPLESMVEDTTPQLGGDLDAANNNIDDIASIDGGGDAIIVNDDLDFNQNNAINFCLESVSSDPGSPAEGEIWFRTDLGDVKICTGDSFGSSLRSANTPSTTPYGIGGDSSAIWHCDGNGNVYELSTSDFSTLRSASGPSTTPYGIGGDSSTIWYCDCDANNIYELSTSDFSTLRSASSPDTWPSGVGGDSNTIWHCDANVDNVYELSTSDFSTLTTVNSPSTTPTGIGGDSSTIWHCDDNTDNVYELSTSDLSTLRTVNSLSETPTGIGGDSNTIWHCDAYSDNVYELSVSNIKTILTTK